MKTIFIDLDGTAVDSPKHKIPSRRVYEATQQLIQLGFNVCAATGRPPSFAEPVLRALELVQPAIVAGGTRIINPRTMQTIREYDIPESSLQQVLRVAHDYTHLKFLWNDFPPEEYYPKGGWDLEKFGDTSLVNFFQFAFVPAEEADGIVAQLEDIADITAILVVAQRPGKRDIHVIHREATKEHAIEEVIDILGVDVAETIGVGDGPNDHHLFNAVGYKVAMGNAVEDLKADADEIIGSVTDDGLAEYFERLAAEAT